LSPYHKGILEQRYSSIVREMQARAARLALFFHTGRTMITVGSLLVPALLSIQTPEGTSPYAPVIYWSTWVISLLVTMCNALIALVKLDKRYYLVHTTLEMLVSEGWQFLELTAKYSGFHTPGVQPTHENQFIFFCHAIEKIRMRQIEEEYYKLSEMQHTGGQGAVGARTGTGPPAAAAAAAPSLVPPTPLQGELARLPPEILQFVQQQLSRAQVDDASQTQGAAAAASTAAAGYAAAPASPENR
jgi:hypothetical protein